MRVFTVVDVRKAGTPEDLLGCKCGPGWPNCLVYLYFLLTELLFWKSKQFLKFTLFLVFILTTVHTSASKYLILFAFRQHEWPWLCMIDQVYSNQSTQKKTHHGVVLVGISEHSLIHALIGKYKTIKSARLILILIMSWNY